MLLGICVVRRRTYALGPPSILEHGSDNNNNNNNNNNNKKGVESRFAQTMSSIADRGIDSGIYLDETWNHRYTWKTDAEDDNTLYFVITASKYPHHIALECLYTLIELQNKQRQHNDKNNCLVQNTHSMADPGRRFSKPIDYPVSYHRTDPSSIAGHVYEIADETEYVNNKISENVRLLVENQGLLEEELMPKVQELEENAKVFRKKKDKNITWVMWTQNIFYSMDCSGFSSGHIIACSENTVHPNE